MLYFFQTHHVDISTFLLWYLKSVKNFIPSWDSTTRSTIPWFQSLFNILSIKLAEINISWIGKHKLYFIQESLSVNSVPMREKKKTE